MDVWKPFIRFYSSEMCIKLTSISSLGLLILGYLSFIQGNAAYIAIFDAIPNVLPLVDYGLATLLLNPLWWTLTMLNLSYISYKTPSDCMLTIIRVASSCAIALALISLIAFSCERRTIVLGLILVNATGCLLYSWITPLLRWYGMYFKQRGLIAFLPLRVQQLLLSTSLLEWLNSKNMYEIVQRYYPFLFQLTSDERKRALQQLSSTERHQLQQRGLVRLFPKPVQAFILPEKRQYKINSELKPSDTLSFGFNFEENTIQSDSTQVVKDEALLQQIVLDRCTAQFITLIRIIPMRKLAPGILSVLFMIYFKGSTVPLMKRKVGILIMMTLGVCSMKTTMKWHQLVLKGRQSIQRHLGQDEQDDQIVISTKVKAVVGCVALYMAFRRLKR